MDINQMNLMNDDFMAIGTGEPVCGIRERYEFMMPMRDGVRLHTVVFVPDLKGPYSMVFSRNPYAGDKELLEFQGRLFCEHGYMFAHQYCRGIGESEGEWEPFANEREDGIDALNYFQEQENIKNIGLYGMSYVGYAAWMVLDALPPKVKTAYIAHFGANRYRQMYCNGLFRHDIYTPWAMWDSGSDRKFTYDDSLKAGLYRPHIEADEAVWGIRLPWYRDWVSHTDYNAPFWKNSFWQILQEMPEKVSIPICLQCGWYDHHFGGMMDGYNALNEEARQKARLLIGPWVHEKAPCIEGHNVLDAFETGEHSYADGLRWMDRILKEEKTDTREIQTYMVGEGWKEYPTWPPQGNDLTLCLSPDGSMTPEETSLEVMKYTYDPVAYIRTHGAEDMLYGPGRGSILQENANRDDTLLFRSEPFAEGLSICGSMEVRLQAASTAEDTAFIATIYEEKPDGRRYNIRTCGTTLLYRNGAENEGEYIPGSKVECTLKMWDILWKLEPGSRLVLRIASSSFPEYHIHTNTRGKGWAYLTETQKAEQSVFVGTARDTVLKLSIL